MHELWGKASSISDLSLQGTFPMSLGESFNAGSKCIGIGAILQQTQEASGVGMMAYA